MTSIDLNFMINILLIQFLTFDMIRTFAIFSLFLLHSNIWKLSFETPNSIVRL